MKRNPQPGHSPEVLKMQSFLKELSVRPLNLRHGGVVEKMPAIDSKVEARQEEQDPRHKHRQTMESPEPRSHSDVAKRFESADVLSRSIEVKRAGQSALSPSIEKKKTNYHMRLPKI